MYDHPEPVYGGTLEASKELQNSKNSYFVISTASRHSLRGLRNNLNDLPAAIIRKPITEDDGPEITATCVTRELATFLTHALNNKEKPRNAERQSVPDLLQRLTDSIHLSDLPGMNRFRRSRAYLEALAWVNGPRPAHPCKCGMGIDDNGDGDCAYCAHKLSCGHPERFARDKNAPGQDCAICEIEWLKREKSKIDIPEDSNCLRGPQVTTTTAEVQPLTEEEFAAYVGDKHMSLRELRAAKLRYEATIRYMLKLKAPFLSSSQKETLWTVCSNLETLLLEPNKDFPASFRSNLTRAFNVLRGIPEPKSEPKSFSEAANQAIKAARELNCEVPFSYGDQHRVATPEGIFREKSEPKLASPRMDEEVVQFHIKCLAGRILTLIDAMISSEVQNKAFKTYVKKEFREQLKRVFGFFHRNDDGDDEKCNDAENVDLG